MKPPGIIPADLSLAQPRYPNLRDSMLAMRKPKEVVQLSSLQLDEEPQMHVEQVTPPPEKKPGVIVENVDELIDKLKNEAKVI